MGEYEEIVSNGIFVIDKPRGPSSHQVTAWIKGILGVTLAGHGGTLDPGVSGVLVVGVNRSARALHYLLNYTKEYIVLARFHGAIERNRVEEILVNFRGPIYQLPPVRAAVKRSLRIRKIEKLDLLEIKGMHVLLHVVSDSGTYMRTLVRDIGDAMGIGAHMEELRRIRTGPFTEDLAVNLYSLKDAVYFCRQNGDCRMLRQMKHETEELFSGFPSVVVKEKAEAAIAYGSDLYEGGIISMDIASAGDHVAIYNRSKKLIAVGIVHNAKIDIERVFVSSSNYKKSWKKD